MNRELSITAKNTLEKMAAAAREFYRVSVVPSASASADVLLLWGVGAPRQQAAFRNYRERGRPVICTDVGYAKDPPGHNRRFRISINAPHPQLLLSDTEEDSRWEPYVERDPVLGSRVLLVDMGPKSCEQYALHDWAPVKLRELLARGLRPSEIVYRPKPRNKFTPLPGVAHDAVSDISRLLKNSCLVVSHHSNVCVEAVAAGVPIECEDGAAMWMKNREWSYENRLSMIRRLSRWQYTPAESREAWIFMEKFLK